MILLIRRQRLQDEHDRLLPQHVKDQQRLNTLRVFTRSTVIKLMPENETNLFKVE